MSRAKSANEGYCQSRDRLFENKGVTVEEAAEFWGVTAWTVRKWIREGRIEARKAHPGARRYLIPRRVLDLHAPKYQRAPDF